MQRMFLMMTVLMWALVNSFASASVREELLMDFNWKFAYGHPYDAAQDFNHGTAYFSYFAKAGYGDGPAAANFDDRAWRVLDVPHDFAVEQPFSASGSHSHGYKAIGRKFPDVSVGWYRKTFEIPEEDLGRSITVTFDGVHRDSKVWINGHYLGNEESGYNSFSYDLSRYLNYGGKNVLSVRVDVTYEEGWYYEGAGIYRHVWLTKTSPLHVDTNGTFVYSEVQGDQATVFIETIIRNDQLDQVVAQVEQQLLDADGKIVARSGKEETSIPAVGSTTIKQQMEIDNPHLWSLDDPYLYQVKTIVSHGGTSEDIYFTRTGIRTIEWKADKGFFLNGEHVKLKGTNNHQDHAGVGTAMPDELQYYRISQLKAMGSNAYRSSHNPPTPELLDACDELGMLVIDENRLMGTAPLVKDYLERLIRRDRNHPSIILWSMGNEEWGIEGTITGERIIQEMQVFASQLDPTRPKNAASSGGWGNGISKHIEIMGFNYLGNGDHDAYHQKFPDKPSVGTEEGSTNTTRGIYFDDPDQHHIAAYDRTAQNGHFKTIEYTWKFYDERDWLAGMFIWTGFDYRGEPTPHGWPSINSYFGMYDVCGFPKDNVWYLKSWWGNEPVLHLFPHWNWQGREGENIRVVAYSNCDEVELLVNGKSAGRESMPRNGHIEWMVPYKAGNIEAIGYVNGKVQMKEKIESTGEPAQLQMKAHKKTFSANGEDLAIITVSTVDGQGRHVPTADQMIHFELDGPGKIIGVGNGDPSCLEPDKYIETVEALKIENMKAKTVENTLDRPEVTMGFDDSSWSSMQRMGRQIQEAKAVVFRGEIHLPEDISEAKVKLFYNAIGNLQQLYVNGQAISDELNKDQKERYAFELENTLLRPGKNEIAIVATPYTVKNSWESPNTDPGVVQVIIPAAPYQRSLFSGYAQVIVQTGREAGSIRLTAKAEGLKPYTLVLNSEESMLRPYVE